MTTPQNIRDQIVDLALEIARTAELGDRARKGKRHVVVESDAIVKLMALASMLPAPAPAPVAEDAPGPR